MKSKIDYRSTKIKSENFFFERLTADTKKKQNNLIKNIQLIQYNSSQFEKVWKQISVKKILWKCRWSRVW